MRVNAEGPSLDFFSVKPWRGDGVDFGAGTASGSEMQGDLYSQEREKPKAQIEKQLNACPAGRRQRDATRVVDRGVGQATEAARRVR